MYTLNELSGFVNIPTLFFVFLQTYYTLGLVGKSKLAFFEHLNLQIYCRFDYIRFYSQKSAISSQSEIYRRGALA